MNKQRIKIFELLLVSFFITNMIGPLIMLFNGDLTLNNDWKTADRTSTGIAPDPSRTPEAVILVYAARAFNWRGIFAVHNWIATKENNAVNYSVHHVLGWNKYRNLPVVVSDTEQPDRAWYGYTPVVVKDIRGDKAEKLIPFIDKAIAEYPYKLNYNVWPGPNSNTFIAYIGRKVPELELNLPSSSIGKDYLVNGRILDIAPSGRGFQFSIYGLFGILLSKVEGFEINILGLVTGINPFKPAIKLPGIGEINLDRL